MKRKEFIEHMRNQGLVYRQDGTVKQLSPLNCRMELKFPFLHRAALELTADEEGITAQELLRRILDVFIHPRERNRLISRYDTNFEKVQDANRGLTDPRMSSSKKKDH